MTTSTEVGVYSAGAKIAQAATIMMMVLNIFFSPRASEFYHQNKHQELKRLYFMTLIGQAISTLILIVSKTHLFPETDDLFHLSKII